MIVDTPLSHIIETTNCYAMQALAGYAGHVNALASHEAVEL